MILGGKPAGCTVAKHDDGKIKPSLVPTEIIRDIARVRMFGVEKYHDPDNWHRVERKRYVDALLRHILKYIDDARAIDDESGFPHLWHIACNVAFLCEMQDEDQKEAHICGQANASVAENQTNN